MNSLRKYILEGLSKENIEKISVYVNDNNIDEIISILNKHVSSKLSEDTVAEYNKFFDKHGILNLNWGRKNGAVKQFVNLFNEENHVNVLDSIIKNDGVISVKELPQTGNIFDYCKIKVEGKTELVDWTEEARTIATWINSKSSAAGPAEMLLKFMLKEGMDKGVGDVGIQPDDEMEVKAATLNGNKPGSGGHPAGQKGTIRKTWSIYYYLNNNVLGIESDNAYADKCAYFQNEKGIIDFNTKISNAKLSKETIVKGIVDALCYQYNFISNEKNAKNTLDDEKIKSLYKSAISFAQFNKGFNKQDLLNLVGCIQLYLYSQIEKFKYFFCILIDKNDENTNDKNGFYILFNNCDSNDTTLLEFATVTKHIYFGVLDSTTSNQGRTGKIYINKK